MKQDKNNLLNQSITKALSILACFTDENPSLRVCDIAHALELSPSTVSRILATMEQLRFIERDSKADYYTIGPQIITLAGVALNHMDLYRQALGELQTLEARLGLGANLAVLKEDSIFYLANVDGPKAPRMYTLLGKRNPLHATAMGKVLLAYLPEADRKQIIARLPMNRYTPNTIGDIEELQANLSGIVSNGYGIEREELAFGRACIAAPIRDKTSSVIAAVSISGPMSEIQLDQQQHSLAATLIEAADRVSLRLGFITRKI